MIGAIQAVAVVLWGLSVVVGGVAVLGVLEFFNVFKTGVLLGGFEVVQLNRLVEYFVAFAIISSSASLLTLLLMFLPDLRYLADLRRRQAAAARRADSAR